LPPRCWKAIRVDDAAARIGGEEFALLLVNTGEKEAQAIAERIRLAVSAEQSHLPERMTISMGVYTTHDNSVTAEACVQRADEAMYEAKTADVTGWSSGIGREVKKARISPGRKELIFCLEIEDILFKFTN
jgi:diguanylate cyclase (GGDEF)-like protein